MIPALTLPTMAITVAQNLAIPTISAKFGFEIIKRLFLFPERYIVKILILSTVLIVLPLIALAYGVKKLYEKHFPETP